MNRPKLLFYCPFDLSDDGGVPFLLTHAVDLLKEKCQIVLLLTSRPNWDVVNSKYQSHLSEDDMRVVIVKPATRWLKLLRLCFNCYAPDPELRPEALVSDLCVSFVNLGYFGKPAIHFVVDVYILNTIGIKGPRYTLWTPSQQSLKESVLIRARKFLELIKHLLYVVFGYRKRLRKALTKNGDRIVANSRWIASFFEKEKFPVDFLYPPVVAEFSHVPLTQRSADFVCIGRISGQKRIETMIEILAEVRRRSGRELQFHIIGYLTERPYSGYIRELAGRHPWVKLEGPRFGKEKERLLTGCRYAIHACEFEAFGISVAEYLKAGCVPFVPSEGGGAEIVGRSELCYKDFEDAVEKILNFLERDDAQQAEVQTQMLERGNLFTLKNFDENLMAFFEEELAKRGFPGMLRDGE